MSQTTIDRGTAETYYVRNRGAWMWALFLVDNERGAISIQSDYGDYGHFWSAPGRGTRTLKEFLISAGTDYVMNKFSYGREKWFDGETTEREIRGDILRRRREGSLSKEDARECWDEADDFEFYDSGTHMLNISGSMALAEKLYDGDMSAFPYHHGYPPQLVAFMREVWPLFIDELKREIPAKAVS